MNAVVAASSGPGANAKPGLEHRVVPDLGEEEDVAEQQARRSRPRTAASRARRARRRARAGARSSTTGAGMAGAAAQEDRAEDGRGRRRRASTRSSQPQCWPWVSPSVSRPTAATAARSPSRSGSRVARASRTSGASRSASTIAISPSGTLTMKISRQLTSTSRPPSGGAIEAPTAPIAGPRADHRRALLGREQRQHEPERVRRQRRGADALEHARGDERLDRRRDRAQRGAEREQREPDDEQPPAPVEVAEPPGGHEHGGEARSRRRSAPTTARRGSTPGKSRAQVRERDVDDEEVEDREEDGEADDGEDARTGARAVASCNHPSRRGCMMQLSANWCRCSTAPIPTRSARSPARSRSIGERWSVLIVRDAFLGRARFSDFQRSLGIARNVLTQRLAHLVDEGVLEHADDGALPPDQQGPRARARAAPAHEVGRPPLRARRPAAAHAAPRLRRRASRATWCARAAASTCGSARSSSCRARASRSSSKPSDRSRIDSRRGRVVKCPGREGAARMPRPRSAHGGASGEGSVLMRALCVCGVCAAVVGDPGCGRCAGAVARIPR